MTKNYSIFLKGKCVITGLTEYKFKNNWEILQNLVGVMRTDYTAEDLSYVCDWEPEGEDSY